MEKQTAFAVGRTGAARTIVGSRWRNIAPRQAPSETELDADLIDKLMRLAALRLEAQERELLKDNLQKIVHLIDAMQAADTDGVEPLDHPLDGVQPLRPDQVTEAVDRDRFQTVAPEVRDGLYLVPRVVE